MVYGGDFGYNKNNWSFSVSVDHRSLSYIANASSGEINVNFFLSNIIYNFQPFANKANIYLGGGFGVAQGYDSAANSPTHIGSAAQLQFGAKFPVNEKFSVFADLRSTAAAYYTTSYTSGYYTYYGNYGYYTSGYSSSILNTLIFASINIGGKYNF